MPDLRPFAILIILATGPARGQDRVLPGAGATFPYPLYSKWFRAFEQRHPGLRFEYKAEGSDAGIRDLEAGAVDFAASDMPLSDSRIEKLEVLQIPSVLGAVVPIYNLKGIARDLRFTPDALAGIFLGRITSWNDPAIRTVNRGVHLPNREIVVVHRSDGSGTSYVLSDFLSKTSTEWNARIGRGATLAWPTGTGASGNAGMAQKVQQTPDSIGYAEFIYALRDRLSFGLVKNAAGEFAQADLDSIAAAARGASISGGDFQISITNAPGPSAYPLASFTYLLIPRKPREAWKSEVLRQFLDWMLTIGQRQSAALGYGALPEELAAQERSAIQSLR